MKDLLYVEQQAQPSEGCPLYVQYSLQGVPPPYLVTSSKGLVWVERHRVDNGTPCLWAATRNTRKEVAPDTVYQEVLALVKQRAQRESWDSFFPYTEEGLKRACQQIHRNTGSPAIVLASEMLPWLKDSLVGIVDWIPKGEAVAVPFDLQQLGMLVKIGTTVVTALVYRPTTALVFLCG